MKKARHLAERLGMETTAFAFVPDEQPICDQDPVHALFIAFDGRVAPCINAAYGGPGRFLNQSVNLPHRIFGRLPDQDLMAIWHSSPCVSFREGFIRRDRAYDAVLSRSQFDASFIKLQEAFQDAQNAMPPAAKGCRICHYLYGV